MIQNEFIELRSTQKKGNRGSGAVALLSLYFYGAAAAGYVPPYTAARSRMGVQRNKFGSLHARFFPSITLVLHSIYWLLQVSCFASTLKMVTITEKLIKIVHKYPILYGLSHPNYKNIKKIRFDNSVKQNLPKNLKQSQWRIKQLSNGWTRLFNMYPKTYITQSIFSLCRDESTGLFDLASLQFLSELFKKTIVQQRVRIFLKL